MDTNTNENTIVSVIAHDLKDPLRAILGISDILLNNWNEISEKDKLSFLEDIHSSSELTHSLLEDLLIWSKGVANNFKTSKTKFNIRDLIEKNLEFAIINANSKGVNISNKVKTDIYVNADKNMISTVLRNLISNAIKYINPEGNIEISATSANGFCNLCISDNGNGITDPLVKDLFNEVNQMIDLKTPGYKRKGLGLILCKDFVIRNGGKIWYKSVRKKGTQFYFTIPLWELTLPFE